MNSAGYITHQSFLKWLIGFSLLVFALILSWQLGYLDLIIAGDRTGLSLTILVAFLLVNIHVMYRAFVLSWERNAAEALIQLMSASSSVNLALEGKQTICCGEVVGYSLASRHISNLVKKLRVMPTIPEQTGAQTHLLAALERRIRSGQRYGWLIADLMIKLGLIGTVIGFVIMLGSVAVLDNFDISTMQQLMTSMTSGMQIALFTTLTGLVAGLLLGIQYHFLDGQADAVLTAIEEMAEIYVLPVLSVQVKSA